MGRIEVGAMGSAHGGRVYTAILVEGSERGSVFLLFGVWMWYL